MEYPTLQQAKDASHEQVCVWHMYLPSPGMNLIRKYHNTRWTQEQQNEIDETTDREQEINKLLFDKFIDGGGFNPELSKKIGWDPAGPYISAQKDAEH